MDCKEFEKLKQNAMPIIDWLKQNGHPHMQVIVDEQQIRVVEDVVSVPIEKTD